MLEKSLQFCSYSIYIAKYKFYLKILSKYENRYMNVISKVNHNQYMPRYILLNSTELHRIYTNQCPSN